ncbi:MAG: D-alanyl-D-alanine carboxypeptidase family protein [Acidobacteria bacterium]|nr:D-alanyl-D-alanine carboxypeptidase family protein [Acidobacteriota bacterium]
MVGRIFSVFALSMMIMFGHLRVANAAPEMKTEAGWPSAGLLDEAASQNSVLKTNLQWFFGGKVQRGWYLYTPLIGRLLGGDHDAGSREFAEGIYRWQQAYGLNSTGVLDRDTWMSMVGFFQAGRAKGQVATRESLILAPESDFYDPARPLELRYVDREAYAAYKRMIDAAAKAGTRAAYLKIVSAFRSPAYQAALRRNSPNSGRAGLAINSPHFTGRALDLYVGAEPVSTSDPNRLIQINTPAYQWLVKNAHRFGFHPYFYEPWHWEYRP